MSRVKQSVDEGVKEIRLTSEDAGAYGLDIGTNIVELLRDVLTAVPDGVMVKLGMVRCVSFVLWHSCLLNNV